MKPLIIKGGDDTPRVTFDKKKSKYEMKGKSLPENVQTFYKPVFDWLDEYAKDPDDETLFVFNLEYLNTASSKIITDIIDRLNKINDLGKKVKIRWCYDPDDNEMKQLGSDISFFTNIPFEFVEYIE